MSSHHRREGNPSPGRGARTGRRTRYPDLSRPAAAPPEETWDDATTWSCRLDPAEWPDWTDARFGLGGGRP